MQSRLKAPVAGLASSSKKYLRKGSGIGGKAVNPWSKRTETSVPNPIAWSEPEPAGSSSAETLMEKSKTSKDTSSSSSNRINALADEMSYSVTAAVTYDKNGALTACSSRRNILAQDSEGLYSARNKLENRQLSNKITDAPAVDLRKAYSPRVREIDFEILQQAGGGNGCTMKEKELAKLFYSGSRLDSRKR